MKFISFNINGLRAHIHQLEVILQKYQPDVIGLQETKIHDDMFPYKEIEKFGYYAFCHGQKGHYGVAFLTKKMPVSVHYGFPEDNEESQRRIIMVECSVLLGKLTVINGYFPQGENRNHPTKFQKKEKFYLDLHRYLEKRMKKDDLLLIMGDMNISPADIDIGIGCEYKKSWIDTGRCSFLPEERRWMQNLLDWGLIDVFRKINPETKDCFSWFDYRSNSFEKNRGLRIDLLLASFPLAKLCIETGIDYQIRSMKKPSDHAPVWAVFKL